MILAGDIGGTKTILALFKPHEKSLKLLLEERFVSKDYPNLEEIVKAFLSKHPEKLKRAAFGIAGPVQSETAKATNLCWTVNSKTLAAITSCPVHLLNDLEANAWGISVLAEKECHLLQRGSLVVKGNQALISAGTGLGEAGLYYENPKYLPFACEGGHVDFSPRDERDIELWKYLHQRFGHVSFERVLSGQGLVNLYDFLTTKENKPSSSEVQEEIKRSNPGKVISDYALKQKDPTCLEALNWMVSLYGSAAGNLALKFMATSGVYIGGGIAPKILPLLETDLFLKPFCAKGRFEEFLKKIPIKVILNEKTALLGASQCAFHFHSKSQ